MEKLAKEISDNMRQYESRSFVSGSHNFKIDMMLMMHAFANTFKSDKQISMIYKMMKDVNADAIVIVNQKIMKKTLGFTDKTFYGVIKRMIENNIIKKIDWTGPRGYAKYILNPYMIYNFRKTKSNKMYAENCNYWNSL